MEGAKNGSDEMGGEKAKDNIKGKWLVTRAPYILVVLTGLSSAGLNVISKVWLNRGMSSYVLLAYGHAFGTLATPLLALLLERNSGSKLSPQICANIFCTGVLGAAGRLMMYSALKYTSPAFAIAMTNLIPSVTFIFAIVFRMEKVDIGKPSSQAKIAGTVIAFGGAVLMTLFKGPSIISLQHPHTRHQISSSSSHHKLSYDGDLIKGSFFLVAQNFIAATFFILQAKTAEMYPASITATSLTSLSGTLVSGTLAAILEHRASSWRLSWDITLAAPLYTGVISIGIAVYLNILVIRQKGPVFVTASRPLATIFAAIMGVFILGDKLHLGEILGASMIVVGLYALLWGKKDEKNGKLLSTTTAAAAATVFHQDIEGKLEK